MREHNFVFSSGKYKSNSLSRYLNNVSKIDDIVAHPRGFEPLAS